MTLVSPSHSFQFLKGTIKTTFYDDEDHFGDVFQSLIGTIKTIYARGADIRQFAGFQSLIGTIKTLHHAANTVGDPGFNPS